MPERKFLLQMLAGIFIVQASVFMIGVGYCVFNGGFKTCPEMKETYETTFAVMTATTLALLSRK